LPDIIIAKKVYPLYREQQEIRYWELKHYNNAQPDPCEEYERFLEDLEEDPVLRANVNLHKLPVENAKMKVLEDRILEITPNFEVKQSKKSLKFQKELDRWLTYGVAPDSYQQRMEYDREINEKWRVQNMIIL
jgi:hypothetical protein